MFCPVLHQTITPGNSTYCAASASLIFSRIYLASQVGDATGRVHSIKSINMQNNAIIYVNTKTYFLCSSVAGLNAFRR